MLEKGLNEGAQHSCARHRNVQMLVVVTLLLQTAPVVGLAGLPFVETFETNPPSMAGNLGLINGQHEWSSDAGAMVQTNNVYDFHQAACLSNASLSRTFAGAETNVWTVFACCPSLLGTSPQPEDMPPDSTVVFWVSTNGYLSAYSNHAVVETGFAVDTSTWSRVLIHSDYDQKEWSLWWNGSTVFEDFGFFTNAASGITGMIIKSSGAVTYVDDIRLTTNTWNPAAGDTDGDGMPDEWERGHWLSPNISDGTGDSDGDGWSDGNEEIANTDPTDPASLFEVSEPAYQEPAEVVIRWTSSNGRLYSIDERSDLTVGIWANVESNIAAVPPENVYTVLVDSVDIGFVRVGVQKD